MLTRVAKRVRSKEEVFPVEAVNIQRDQISLIPIDNIKIGKKHTDQERVQELAQSIATVGMIHPVTVANDELVAGYNRLEACKLLGITSIPAIVKHLNKIKREILQIDENLIRRKLSVIELGELMLRRDQLLTKLGLRAKAGDNKHTIKNPKTKTTKDIAKDIGIGKRSAQLIMQIARDLTKSVKETIIKKPLADKVVALRELSRVSTKDQKKVLAKLPENPEREHVIKAIKAVKREENIKKMHRKAMSYTPDDSVKLITGDFRDVCREIEDNSVDAIVTDPPYLKEYNSLWSDLATTATRILKPGGYLIAYTGITYLPEVINHLLASGLNYYWLAVIAYKGNATPILPYRNVMQNMRPVLIFSKGTGRKPDRFGDLIQCNKIEKDFHDWQQAIDPFRYLITKFTKPSDLIVDPFVCTGTVALASVIERRRCIGIDVEDKNIKIAKGRLQQHREVA